MLLEALPPERKWRAIGLATALLVPAFWSLLAGLVALAADDPPEGPAPAAAGRGRIPVRYPFTEPAVRPRTK